MQSLLRIAKDAIPRSAENIALAIGALCAVRVSLVLLDLALCFII